jgi:SHS2 domain-containing protein
MSGWQHFQHMADIGVHGFGATLAEAFEQAALAMTAVITDPATVQQGTVVEVACTAPDHELLLVDWLNAWVYEMATRNMLFSRFQVTLADGGLHGRGWGEALDRARHQPAVEIKGATYTELRVWQDADATWHAQCVVDV